MYSTSPDDDDLKFSTNEIYKIGTRHEKFLDAQVHLPLSSNTFQA